MRAFFLPLLCLAAVGSADWTLVPPPPSDSTVRDAVLSVVAHRNAMWAMTPSGLFRSVDSGHAWRSARPVGFPRNHISSLSGRLFSVAGCLYATSHTGLFFTCDDGVTWKKSSSDSSAYTDGYPAPLNSITRMEGDSSLIMAGDGDRNEPYLSTDRGLTWKAAPPPFPSGMEMNGIFQDGPRLWVSAGYPYQSDDGGKTWSKSYTPDQGTIFVRELGRLWALGGTPTLASSADTGKNWETHDIELPYPWGSLNATTLVSVEGDLFASGTGENIRPMGVFMSSDTGKTWVARNQGLPTSSFSVDTNITNASGVYALGRVLLETTGQGIYRSDDLGAHWRASNSGIPTAITRNGAPEFLYLSGNRIYARAMTDYRYSWYVTADTARSWQAWRPGFGDIETLAFTASAAFALRKNPDSALTDPIYRSDDGMKTWSPVPGPWTPGYHPTPDRIFASGTHVYVTSDLFNGPNGLSKVGYWRSNDEGVTWTTDTDLGNAQAFQWHATVGSRRFRSDGWMVSVSADSGRTWKPSLPIAGQIFASAILGQTLLVVYPDTEFVTRISASSDGGKTWQSLFRGSGDAKIFGVTTFAGAAYVATGSGLRVSRNGQDWEDIHQTGMSPRGARLIAAAGENLVAVTEKGLHYSTDSGAHWRASPFGYPGDIVWLAARQNVFFAGTTQSGVWSSVDSGRIWSRRFEPLLLGLGLGAGPDDLVLIDRSSTIEHLPDPNGQMKVWSAAPGKELDYCSLALADGGLYLAKAEGGFVSAGPGVAWSSVKFPGSGPHDFLAGDGQRLAVSSADGIFWRGSASSDWQPADPGLPKDDIAALAMDGGRLFAASYSNGLWMSKALPVAVRPQAKAPLLAEAPVILAAADGGPLFRLRLAQPAMIRLSLHAATGRALATLESKLSPGIQDVRPRLREHGAVFYRLEVRSMQGSGEVRVFRGRIP